MGWMPFGVWLSTAAWWRALIFFIFFFFFIFGGLAACPPYSIFPLSSRALIPEPTPARFALLGSSKNPLWGRGWGLQPPRNFRGVREGSPSPGSILPIL